MESYVWKILRTLTWGWGVKNFQNHPYVINEWPPRRLRAGILPLSHFGIQRFMIFPSFDGRCIVPWLCWRAIPGPLLMYVWIKHLSLWVQPRFSIAARDHRVVAHTSLNTGVPLSIKHSDLMEKGHEVTALTSIPVVINVRSLPNVPRYWRSPVRFQITWSDYLPTAERVQICQWKLSGPY